MSSTPNTPYRPHVCSHDVSKTDMKWQDTWHIPDTCSVCVTIRRRHLDLTISWCENSGCFPPEVSETAAWNPMVRPSPKWWSTTTDRSDFTIPSPIPSTHFGIWACGSTVDDTPANIALQLHINVSLNRPPDHTWRLPPGRPQNKWLDHRCDGPRRLRDGDDDDEEYVISSHSRPTLYGLTLCTTKARS